MVRVLIVGLDGSGKTTLLEQGKGLFASSAATTRNGPKTPSKLRHISSTVGLNVAKVRHQKGSDVVFWDLGGEESMREIWENYYEDADVVVFVVDAANSKRFEEAGRELNDICSDERLRGVPILVLANKQDQSSAREPDVVMRRIIKNEESFRKGRAVNVLGVSALTCEGLTEGIDWAVSASTIAKAPGNGGDS